MRLMPADVLPARSAGGGGEATRWPLLERIEALKPSCRVLNHYGPTETTVGILTQEADEALAGTLSVEAARQQQRSYCSCRPQPVPVGVVGELYLERCRRETQGYQARAAQTARPSSQIPLAAERLYHTGDRVKMLEDGSLEFPGAGGTTR